MVITLIKYDGFSDDAPFIKRFFRDYLRDKQALVRKIVVKTGAMAVGHVHIATKETTKSQLVQLTQNSVKYMREKLLLPKLNPIAVR